MQIPLTDITQVKWLYNLTNRKLKVTYIKVSFCQQEWKQMFSIWKALIVPEYWQRFEPMIFPTKAGVCYDNVQHDLCYTQSNHGLLFQNICLNNLWRKELTDETIVDL